MGKGPRPERYYDKLEVAQVLRMSDKTLDRMIERGWFPRGIKPTSGTGPLWLASVIKAWQTIRPYMPWDDPEEEAEQQGPGGPPEQGPKKKS